MAKQLVLLMVQPQPQLLMAWQRQRLCKLLPQSRCQYHHLRLHLFQQLCLIHQPFLSNSCERFGSSDAGNLDRYGGV